jgi:hypothetical protein
MRVVNAEFLFFRFPRGGLPAPAARFRTFIKTS